MNAYQDEAAAITDINVTPFVDVVLVLLVVLMVTAPMMVGRGIDVDKPKTVHGATLQGAVRLTIDKDETRGQPSPRVVIAGDKAAAYDAVMHAIDLARDAGVAAIALETSAR
jgi:biopolymer transport protein ExbD